MNIECRVSKWVCASFAFSASITVVWVDALRLLTLRIFLSRMARVGLLLLVGMLAWIPLAQAGGVTITRVSTELRDGGLWLDADAQLDLFKDQGDALKSGVPLWFAWDVVIEQERGWWGAREINTQAWRARIEYHALSQLYRLEWLAAGEATDVISFSSLDGAVDALSHPRSLLLAPAAEFPPPGVYRGRARLRLLADSLPLPMRPRAFFASQWQLVSDWYLWAF
jgi:hypothetical protein